MQVYRAQAVALPDLKLDVIFLTYLYLEFNSKRDIQDRTNFKSGRVAQRPLCNFLLFISIK